jgi:hypothetical protein
MPGRYYNPNQEKFAQKLIEYIDQCGRNRAWLAERLGYRHRGIWNRWMNGDSQMPLRALREFCKLCELDRAQCIELARLAGHEEEIEFIAGMLGWNGSTGDEGIFESFKQTSGALQRQIRIREFQSLVAERTQVFLGRQFIFQAIQTLLTESQMRSGYIVVHGEPGIGKTALVAQLVKQKGYVHHFNIAAQNIRSGRDFLANMCAQLIVKYELPYDTLPQEATKDSGFLSRLLTESVDKARGQPVVILVDALDEAEDYDVPPDTNRLLLPPTLPAGVFFVITTREQADFRLFVDHREDIYLRDNDPGNLDDVRRYIQEYLRMHPDKMEARIGEWRITQEEFVTVMTQKSQGNFMYLVYVLRDIREGRLTAANIDDVRQLPQGLRAYYQRHWRMMRARDETCFEQYYEPVVCLLATVRQPVNIEQLQEWTDLPPRRIKEVIDEWREFLDVEEGEEGELRYHIYHTRFQDFLKEEVGLTQYHGQIARKALGKIPGFEMEPQSK